MPAKEVEEEKKKTSADEQAAADAAAAGAAQAAIERKQQANTGPPLSNSAADAAADNPAAGLEDAASMTSTITSAPLPEDYDLAVRGVPEDLDSLVSDQSLQQPPPKPSGGLFGFMHKKDTIKPVARKRRPKGFSKGQTTQLRELIVEVVVPLKPDDQSETHSWHPEGGKDEKKDEAAQDAAATDQGGNEARDDGVSKSAGTSRKSVSIAADETKRETIKVLVLWPCAHLLVKKKIMGDRGIPVHDQTLVYRGQLLLDADCVPSEAFNDVDEDGFLNRIRLVLPEDGTYNADGSKYSSLSKASSQEDEEAAALALKLKLEQEALRARLRQLRQQENAKFDKMLKAHGRFDIHEELGRLECAQYADALLERGFNEKGAFALVKDEELAGSGLWIPRKYRRRIVALAEMYRQQFEKEDAARTTTTDRVQEASTEKYTIDGQMYYSTVEKLQHEWNEATQYFDMVEQDGEEAEAVKKEKDSLATRVADADKLDDERERSVQVLDKYVELRQKGRVLNREQLRRRPRPKRTHGTQASRVMHRIELDNRRDEWGVLTRFPKVEPRFCCAKHGVAARHRLNQYLEKLRAEVATWLREELTDLDRGADGFIALADLRELSAEVLFEYGIEPTDSLLDGLIRAVLHGDDLLIPNTTKLLHMIEKLVVDTEAHRLRSLTGNDAKPLHLQAGSALNRANIQEE